MRTARLIWDALSYIVSTVGIVAAACTGHTAWAIAFGTFLICANLQQITETLLNGKRP